MSLSRSLVALLLAASPVAAQTPSGPARLRGQVTDSLGIAIPSATVLLLGTRLNATTDAQGLFRFSDLKPGNYSVLVRAIGWTPLIFEMTMRAGEEWVGRLGLEEAPTQLPELVVTGRYGKPAKYAATTRFDDFYRRRTVGLGHYATRDQVDAMISSGTGTVMGLVGRMNIPGLHEGRWARCNGPAAKIGVWIDGAKVTNRGGYMPAVGDLLDVRDIEAIEVYRGVAEIPGEFLDDSCAAIVIWTKYN